MLYVVLEAAPATQRDRKWEDRKLLALRTVSIRIRHA